MESMELLRKRSIVFQKDDKIPLRDLGERIFGLKEPAGNINMVQQFLSIEDNRLEWVDDLSREDPPEDHPGMMGCMVNYFDLSALPPGKTWRSAALFYTPRPNITAKDAQSYFNIESHPLVIKVDGRLGRSRILPWHPELPDDYFINYRSLPGEIDLR